MAHKYFCTHCGWQLSQEKVLFDMQYMLIGSDEEKFDLLKFRLSEQELRSLAQRGKPGHHGYIHYDLKLEEFLELAANENNLRDKKVLELDLDMIRTFLDQQMMGTAFTEDLDSGDEDDYNGLFEEEETEEIAPAEEERQLPEPLMAIANQDTTNKAVAVRDRMLTHDLTILKNVFVDGVFHMEFILLEENDDQGGKVLYGYQTMTSISRHILTISSARVCPNDRCGKVLFDHAGTAQHRTVVFIGDQESGKTSTIVALTHYAKNGATEAMAADPIWGKSEPDPGVDSIQLVDPDPGLKDDVASFMEGYATKKTDLDSNMAYSATFRVKNKGKHSRYMILTLTDLPGELFNPTSGKVQIDKLKNRFPAALACEMMILCFDAAKTNVSNAVQMSDNICAWADQFQTERRNYWIQAGLEGAGEEGCYAPMMLLYTKCDELEHPDPKNQPPVQQIANPVAQSYVFYQERLEITTNEIYRRASNQFQRYNNLKNVYFSRLRCSPYGYPAPSRERYEETGGTAELHTPTPLHIDALFKWILSVTRCTETHAVFRPKGINHNTRKSVPSEYVLPRPQYKVQKPAGQTREEEIHEAIARCYLFENPGVVDRYIAEKYEDYGSNSLEGVICRHQAPRSNI